MASFGLEENHVPGTWQSCAQHVTIMWLLRLVYDDNKNYYTEFHSAQCNIGIVQSRNPRNALIPYPCFTKLRSLVVRTDISHSLFIAVK